MYAKSTRPSALGALKLAREARDENVPAKRTDFFLTSSGQIWSDGTKNGFLGTRINCSLDSD